MISVISEVELGWSNFIYIQICNIEVVDECFSLSHGSVGVSTEEVHILVQWTQSGNIDIEVEIADWLWIDILDEGVEINLNFLHLLLTVKRVEENVSCCEA